jgi:molybdopterin-guanine dinucleotide biosynthesis protein A
MTLTGLLLVGGLSRRMGSDKATLVINHQALWARQLSLLRRIRSDAVYIAARAAPAWAPSDVVILLDALPSRGPLSGISSGLATMVTSHLLALAVDLPQMTAEHLQKLIALIQNGKGVVPYQENLAEPLVAVYPKEAVGLAADALASEDVSLQSFARQLENQNLLVRYPVQPEERSLYHNLNTPQDLDH